MLVVQWLRICLPMQGHGLIPGRGIKIPHASGQVYRHTATRESLHATTKTQCGQKRKKRKGEVKHISQFSGSVASDALQASGLQTPGFPVHHNSRSLLKLLSIESVMPSNNLMLCRPLLLLLSIFPSIRVFTSGGQNVGASTSVLPMNIQD